MNRRRHRGGGVAIYLKKNLHFTQTKTNLFKEKEIELTSCVIHSGNSNLLIACVYMGFTNQWESVSDLKIHLSALAREHKCKGMVLVGDLNINLIDHSTSTLVNHLLTDMASINLRPIITSPTRITETNGQTTATLIDNIFTNLQISQVMNQFIGITDLSDHLACHMDVCIGKNSKLIPNHKK